VMERISRSEMPNVSNIIPFIIGYTINFVLNVQQNMELYRPNLLGVIILRPSTMNQGKSLWLHIKQIRRC
jgi:hypothetical protein